MSVYPKGRNEGDKDYLSMYLEIVDTHTLTHDFEVYVGYKLFVYDHLKDMYYAIQGIKVGFNLLFIFAFSKCAC